MAKDGLLALVCAGGLLLTGAEISGLRATDEDRTSAVASALAVQTAMQQGRDFLQRGDIRSAVYVLENQLSQINGNPTYLALLRDAYRAYVKQLRLTNQDAEAQRYLQRLQILDPGAGLDQVLAKTAAVPVPAVPVAAVPAVAKAPTAPVKVEAKVRAVRDDEDDDPFKPTPAERQRKTTNSILARAEEEFASRHYREASALFAQASQADPGITQASRERWAYCKVFGVVEKLNQSPAGGLPWPELEKEARAALELSPRLDYAKVVLAEIEKRRSGAASVTVRHFPRGTDGWARAETTNFRIFHNLSPELAEQAAQVAEKTRTEMGRKWFGDFKDDWAPRCDLYLHATAQDYSRITGVPINSPGHSSIRTEGSRVVGRRIDLHCEDAKNMLTAVLPHEATHVVLAGQFGDQPVPRWADEGMAVLTEPREKVERHLSNLGRCRQSNELFTVKQLMQMSDYPEARRITAFYAQSVSLVNYLTAQKGPQVLTQFLRDAQKTGYEQALQRHYGYKSFDELQQNWSQQAFTALENPSVGVAQAGR